MSQASDLIAEVKQTLARVERGVKSFEQDVEDVRHWPALAQLRIARDRLGLFEHELLSHHVNVEEAATAPEVDVDAGARARLEAAAKVEAARVEAQRIAAEKAKAKATKPVV